MNSGGGMTGAAAGKGGTEEQTGPEDGRGHGTARAGTGVCWHELGTGVPPATGTGTGSTSKHPNGEVAGLTNSSSATGTGEVKLD